MIAFLSPLFLIAAAAAAVPIILHLLKRNPEQRVRFAAVAFLKGAPIEHTSSRRLRELLLLMLRIAALVLLALAFARPFFRSASANAPAGTTVVALDTSFSMSSPGRFDRARTLAKDAIRNAPGGDDVAVVTFSDQADVIVRPQSSRGTAAAAIDAVSPGFGSTRYRAGLNTAGSLFAGRRGTIVVVTDLQESGWDTGDHAAVPEGARVEIRDVGALPENLAVTGLRLDGDRAIATVRNDGPRARQVRARLTVDGKAAGEITVPIAARESAEAVFSNVRGSSNVAGVAPVVAVTIDDADGIPADNVRYALLAGTTRRAVLVATATGDLDQDAFYLHQALVAGRGAERPAEVVGVSAAQLSAWPVDRVARYAVVLLMSTRGLERRGRETLASYMTAGGGLLIATGPDVDGDVIADVLGAGAELRVTAPAADLRQTSGTPVTLAPTDVRHPIFQSFGAEVASLGLVTFRRAARIGGAACQTLAKFTSGEAAILDCGAGEGHAVVVATDLNGQWNDFPLRASFVPFVHETLRYLSASDTRIGEYLIGDVPAGVPPVPGVSAVPPRPGSGLRARRVVVNVDTRESDPARLSADEFQAAVTHLRDAGVAAAQNGAAEQEGRQHLWQYLLAFTIVALTAEGAVAGRSV